MQVQTDFRSFAGRLASQVAEQLAEQLVQEHEREVHFMTVEIQRLRSDLAQMVEMMQMQLGRERQLQALLDEASTAQFMTAQVQADALQAGSGSSFSQQQQQQHAVGALKQQYRQATQLLEPLASTLAAENQMVARVNGMAGSHSHAAAAFQEPVSAGLVSQSRLVGDRNALIAEPSANISAASDQPVSVQLPPQTPKSVPVTLAHATEEPPAGQPYVVTMGSARTAPGAGAAAHTTAPSWPATPGGEVQIHLPPQTPQQVQVHSSGRRIPVASVP
eukprot:TRINITY_DN18623_c0_g1_i1.p1 TRINITY_DN18623_c0_g1~~TRINITY_DN18623_c0_g1_i1.p1  ORF type:complete len:276 (+),score=54.34 TRINITY_DN18623_c0_g1_i1:226-1053(+)